MVEIHQIGLGQKVLDCVYSSLYTEYTNYF